MKRILFVIFFAAYALAQVVAPGGGKVAVIIGHRGASLPASCVDGQLFQKTSGGSEGTYSCVLGAWVAAGSAGSVGSAGTGISIVGSVIAIDSTTTPQKNATGTWTAKQTFGPSIGFTPGSAPGTPADGDVYYDTTAKRLSWYNGSSWLWSPNNPGTTTGDLFYCTDTATPCTLARLAAGTSGYFLRGNGAGAAPSYAIPTAAQVQNAFDITLSNDLTRISAPANPASGYLRVFANNSTGKLACLDNSGADCMPSGGGTPTKLVDSNGADALLTSAASSAVNQVTITNSATGSGTSISASGSDSNIDLKLLPKGNGHLQLGNLSSYSESGIARLGINNNSTRAMLDVVAQSYTLTGTVAYSGTTLTGTGTIFTKELSPYSRIVVNGQARQIVSVASDTSATVELDYSGSSSGHTATVNPAIFHFSDGNSVLAYGYNRDLTGNTFIFSDGSSRGFGMNNNTVAGFYVNSIGVVGSTAPDADNQLLILSGSASRIGLTVRAASSQTANNQEWQKSDGTVLASVGSTGLVSATSLKLLTEAEPTCDSSSRGRMNYVAGGAGVKDTIRVCAKDSGDAYAWRTIY